MKKILFSIILLGISLPALAIVDTSDSNLDSKYQKKIEKIKMKQEMDRLKHPEKYVTSPVKETTMTLGLVQRDVKIGATQADVTEALGSPNIITRDADGRDTWIYDKIASISSYNNSGFSVGAGGLGGGCGSHGAGGGLLNVSYGKNRGNVQTNQKTLTVIIKFDKNSKVESFTYHMSSF